MHIKTVALPLVCTLSVLCELASPTKLDPSSPSLIPRCGSTRAHSGAVDRSVASTAEEGSPISAASPAPQCAQDDGAMTDSDESEEGDSPSLESKGVEGSEAPQKGAKLHVIKRNGKRQDIAFDKIFKRINNRASCLGRKDYVDVSKIAQKVIQGVYPGVRTSELDTLAAETSAYMGTIHPDYQRLAARIAVSNLHKETDDSFSRTLHKIDTAIDPKTER